MNFNLPLKNKYLKNLDPGMKKKVVILIGVLSIILIVISTLAEPLEKSNEENAGKIVSDFSESEYTLMLENKLEDMIGSMDGAGTAKVKVTLECDYETVYAKDTGYSKDDNSSDEDSEYIILGSSGDEDGLVLKTLTPKVRGVAVLCSGGNDPEICQAVISMICALLDVRSEDVSVSKIQYTAE